MGDQQKPWLKHYPPEIPASLEYPDAVVPDLLKEAYEKKPDNIAIRFLGKQLTYAELYHAAVDCARALVKLGVKPGDRVSIMLPNCPQYVIAYYGIMMAGAIVVQTNPLYVERELEYQLNDAGAETIIALDLVYPKIAKVQSRTPLKNVIITSIKDYLPFPKNVLYPLVVKKKQGIQVQVDYGETVHHFKKWLKTGKDVPLNVSLSPDEVALLQYTGGTTGTPKGVMLTHRNLVANIHQCKAWTYKAEYGQERSLGIVPLFHVYGMTVVMNVSIALASTMILLPKFDVDDTLKTIDKERPTLFPGAPTMYIAIINHPDVGKYDLSSIKACLSGSAPLPVEVKNKFEELTNGKLVEGYGLSETSPVTHANLIWGKNVVGSIGIPWPDTDVKVVREDGSEAEVNEIGEIAIKGPQVMKGYWRRPEETEKTLKEGWLLTGDMGYMDEEGYFYIVDRKKDMIIAGGYNIYPREVEEVLYEHPAVQECAVIGVPDEYRGETVKAFIVKKEGKEVTEDELNEYCRSKLAAYKVPRIYEFRNELPKSMVGKVLRRVLAEEERKKVEQDKNQKLGS
ncbi:AMP-dependent synthetase and ligase [Caldalkalibacillus thermarum TA2.A1]|uniref:AMP-dependent synthetase and ligase n=1 Tax=Caldalkalibacillus thermarum (strain TA2.A1) TaxID=986075 RepID=F5L3G9_CALTT|nr:long-chain fatty acid--CoA ligase [Caldalkalibacillus thermarum]EGL84114.1 AMP-dependent synthetase and ligase [Caldalkalibacillus thermarum TA2.A1]QZT33624.1 long-chain fatty acid--CoA ligase [Caldalkalibacillus thermarum TA2.A1]